MTRTPWTAGEALLAVEAAHRLEWINPSQGMPAVIELSRLLAGGPFHPGLELPPNFRNPNAVKMKISNLVWHYSNGKRGLSAGAGQDLALVRLYQSDPITVLRLARDLRTAVGEMS